jgi:ketosteroid isomerase-like protein
MFERYTEKARRAIFFARYEASQYGAAKIESEHLLLGLLREDRALADRFMKPSASMGEIRDAIEKQIKRGQFVSTSVEMPVAEDSKKIFDMAGEEADRLGHGYVGTEHLLLAMTRTESSLAGRLLHERGLRADAVRAALATTLGPVGSPAHASSQPITGPSGIAKAYLANNALNSFLANFKHYDWERLSPFFAENAQFVDAAGKRWKGRAEIEKQFQALFAPYAKKNVTFLIEATDPGPTDSFTASILWENVSMGTVSGRSTHRMTIVLSAETEDWSISLIQVTPLLL